MRCVLGCYWVTDCVGCGVSDEPELVECTECGDKVPDFTPEAECIGWLGRCAKCEMNDVDRKD